MKSIIILIYQPQAHVPYSKADQTGFYYPLKNNKHNSQSSIKARASVTLADAAVQEDRFDLCPSWMKR